MSSMPKFADSPVPPRTADTPTKVYKGGCHCKKFEFECRHPVVEDGFEVTSCNCSICAQRGYLVIYILNPKEDFKLLKGARSDLAHYQFNNHWATHMFCPVCGSGFFVELGQGESMYLAVNVRAIQDLDLEKVTLRKFNGRALP